MKFETSPLISVVIPVFNGSTFIKEAVDSVLSQTYSNFELIVINDGSTDDSEIKILSYENIKYKKLVNSGPAVARNLGCRLANGRYIAFLDQDDIWLPEKLEKQVNSFLSYSEIGFVLCHQSVLVDKHAVGLPISVSRAVEKFGKIISPSFSPSSLMIKSEVIQQLGGFNESYSYYSEAEIFLRLREMSIPSEMLPEVLFLKRFHGANLSYRTDMTSTELLRIARDSLKKKNLKYAYGST